jgi:CheY-like chemotaxis protein
MRVRKNEPAARVEVVEPVELELSGRKPEAIDYASAEHVDFAFNRGPIDKVTLNRYAALVLGSYKGGQYVNRTLEIFSGQNDRPPDYGSGPDHLALFRIFTQLILLRPPHALAEPYGDFDVPKAFREMNIVARQLIALEFMLNFSEEAVINIFQISRAQFADMRTVAIREFSRTSAKDVLIIEDETFMAIDLENICVSVGHRVLGVARTHSEALAIAKDRPPGFILADIQLADGSSGLSAVNDILQLAACPVIFVTAYPERFLTGNRPEPAFLVAKPYQPALVRKLLVLAALFDRKGRVHQGRP